MKQFLNILFLLILVGSAAGGEGWKIIDNMPVPVAGGEAVVYDGKIYIFGGFSDSLRSAVDLVQAFDPAAPEGERWSVAGRMQVARGNFIARLFEDRVFILGGRSGFVGQEKIAPAEVYNPAEGISRLLAGPPVLNRIDASGVIWNHLLLVIGGYVNLTAADMPPYLVIYDLVEDKIVQQFDPFPGLIQYDQVTAAAGDRLFIFGGIRQGVSNRVYELNLANWQFSRIHPDLKRPLAGFTAVTALNDSIYLIGGYNEKLNAGRSVIKFTITPRGYEFHEDEQALNLARRELTAAYLDSAIYVFGGRNAFQVVPEVEQLSFKNSALTRVVEKASPVVDFALEQNYPNPFNSSTTIAFALGRPEAVRLNIYSADGRLIRSHSQFCSAGRQSLHWDGADDAGLPVNGGVYFYRLTVGDQTLTKKMLLVK